MHEASHSQINRQSTKLSDSAEKEALVIDKLPAICAFAEGAELRIRPLTSADDSN